MFCTFCGEKIHEDFKRCPYCGSLLRNGKNTDYSSKNTNTNNFILVDESAEKEASYTKVLSNKKKVFITASCTIIPCFGQLAGIITAIFFINAGEDNDRKSFGKSLLITCLIVFVISCLYYALISVLFIKYQVIL